jgi:E1A/CREB-binding protein
MLDKGAIEHTVIGYKDIYKQAVEDGITSPHQMPYFEGDYWPNVIEDCVREADAEEAERKKAEQEQANNFEELEDNDDSFEVQRQLLIAFTYFQANGKGKKRTGQKTNKKKTTKAKAGTLQKKKKGGNSGVYEKLLGSMEKNKDVFFTIRLTPVQTANTLGDIVDPDPLINSELMDSRDAFLTRARDDHWEFR